MRSSLLRACLFLLGVLLPIPAAAMIEMEQPTGAIPPIAQPLMREGDLAVDLAEALKLGTAMNETEAESALSAVGIMPRNGWIADYPVTPDIIGELQASLSDAADSGKLAVGKDMALAAFQKITQGQDMSVRAAESESLAGATAATNYPETTVINNYYTAEGPPVVTYYAPPPDYAYLYTWVPYPFWWSDFWFPGFFVLVDFHTTVHAHEHGHVQEHGHFISNHFHDPRTNRMSRIDPTNRSFGGTFSETRSWRQAGPSGQRGAPPVRTTTGAYRDYSRGYGVTRPPSATRSSAFDRSSNNRIERASSDRGYRSRSQAGQIPQRGSTGGGAVRSGNGSGSRSGSGGGRYNGSGRPR